jgi:hypothetical protein
MAGIPKESAHSQIRCNEWASAREGLLPCRKLMKRQCPACC